MFKDIDLLNLSAKVTGALVGTVLGILVAVETFVLLTSYL